MEHGALEFLKRGDKVFMVNEPPARIVIDPEILAHQFEGWGLESIDDHFVISTANGSAIYKRGQQLMGNRHQVYADRVAFKYEPVDVER